MVPWPNETASRKFVRQSLANVDVSPFSDITAGRTSSGIGIGRAHKMYHRFKWTKVSNRRNWISREYEPLQPYYLLELSKMAGAQTFVDVGANVGMYSVMMSQAIDGILAYEANDALADEVEANFALNQIKGTVRRVAVSREPGTLNFGIVSRYAGNSSVVEGDGETDKFASTNSVQAVCLDDELASLDGPLVLKIDVEGHEMAVLEGAKKALKEKPCIMQVETFEDGIEDLLFALGYRKLTAIGPDNYITNIEGLKPLEAYEKAAASWIEANHENKSMSFGRGGVSVVISGGVYEGARRLAKKVMGRRL